MIFAVGLGALRARVARFRRDKRGAIAMLFALAILPLLFLVGLAVDFRTLQTARSDLQNALDSALLAAARVYNVNPDLSDTQREAAAIAAGEAMFKSNLRDAGPPLTEQDIVFTFNSDTNLVTATGSANSATAFGGLMEVFGGDRIDVVRISVYGEAQGADPRRLEIVLALDNTGSMFVTGGSGERRFDLMRSAAKNFVNTLFNNQANPDKLYVGVVPWTTTVNVNMERPISTYEPDAYNAPDVDTDGTREIPPAPFQSFRGYLRFPYGSSIAPASGSASDAGHSTLLSNPPTMTPAWTTLPGVAYDGADASHVAAFGALFAPVEWRGCIRSANGERQMTGDSVNSALTDAPPSPMRWQVDAVEPILKTFSDSGQSGRLKCGTGSSRTANDADFNSYISGPANTTRPCRATDTGSNTTTPTCVSDAYEFAWLARTDVPDYCSFKTLTVPRQDYDNPWMAGPNVNCPTAMLGLSGSREQVLKKLNMMYANSDGTHADIGLMWGLRMLSPNASWHSFFGTNGDNAPRDYNTDDTRKILILLTDGSNVVPSRWEGYYGCSASTANRNSGAGRASDSPALPRGAERCWVSSNVQGSLTTTKLNNLTQNACDAIRNDYHIELFTIGVDIGSTSTAAALLRSCVGNDNSRAKIISAAEIDETFMQIANETLRLTR